MTHRSSESCSFLEIRYVTGPASESSGPSRRAANVTDRDSVMLSRQVASDLKGKISDRALPCKSPGPSALLGPVGWARQLAVVLPLTRPNRFRPEGSEISQRKLTGLMGAERGRRHPHRRD
jgi:hypothetical protein